MVGVPRKGAIPSIRLDARYLSLPLHTTGSPQVATSAPEPQDSESEEVSPCVGSLRGTAWGSRNLFHQLNHCWILKPEVVGTYLPGTGGPGVDLGLLPLMISLSNFYLLWYGTSPFCICAPLSSHFGCGFFNSVVVRLPFNSISDIPE